MLPLQAAQPGCTSRAVFRAVRAFGELDTPVQMPACHALTFLAVAQALGSVLSECFEEAVARLAPVVGHQNERLIHQPRQEVEDACLVEAITSANLLGHFKIPAASEDRKSP